MTFKINWERAVSQHKLPEGMITKMMALAYPNKKIKNQQIIAGGCANLNVKMVLEDNLKPLILRIYLRDKNAAYSEQKVGELLKSMLPVPCIHYIGNIDSYCFAIADFIPGRPLRDLLLGDEQYDMQSIMHEVGTMLAKIAQQQFPNGDFSVDRDGHINFVRKCLENTIVVAELTAITIAKISHYLDKYGHLFSDNNTTNLVHADFDPANILIDQVDGVWKITGILDWEFSHSGSVLCDVANMLRYAHCIDFEFEKNFLLGLQLGGVTLPADWRITVHMLNLLSLLDCLKRSDSENRPNQCADICELINHILQQLDNVRKIEIVSYNYDWPTMYAIEAAKIKQALGDNCIAMHHIGSTAVPGLAAKPVIDMVPVVLDIHKVNTRNPAMIALGYEPRGEYGMPGRRYFQKGSTLRTHNIHVFAKGNLAIDRHLNFRDWMRSHPKDREHYAQLKKKLALQYPNDIRSYSLGKDDFIANIDSKAGS